MITYNGEYFLVKSSGSPLWKQIKDIAEKSSYPSVYSSNEGIWYIMATKKNARALDEIGLEFSPEASGFLERAPEQVYVPAVYDFSILSKDLFPFQKDGVQWLDSPGNKLLGDEMGLGKTVQVAALFRYRPDLLPALVVCPASLKINWQREIESLSGVKAQIIYGNKPYEIAGLLEKFPVVIINYDILGQEDPEAKKAEAKRIEEAKKLNRPYKKKTLPVHGWCDTFAVLGFNSIVCDEVQFIANEKTNRTRAVNQISKNRNEAKRIFLSGTPYENCTSQFFTCLNLLAPKVFPNRWGFQMTYCDARKDRWGWHFDGLSNGEQLHKLVKPLMLRRLKADVLKQLPPKQKFIVPMELNDKSLPDYRNAENAFDTGLKEGKQPSFAGMKIAAYAAKREACIQWIKDYLETATVKKLVVFFWHKKVLEDLQRAFDEDIRVCLSGETHQVNRQQAVDMFQNDSRIQLFFGQLEASGVGLTLTAASACCFVEFGESAGQHSQGEDRIHRITQESDSVFAYYLIASNTIEEDIMNTLTFRNKNQKMVLDGKTDEKFFEGGLEDFRAGILSQYRKRKSLLDS